MIKIFSVAVLLFTLSNPAQAQFSLSINGIASYLSGNTGSLSVNSFGAAGYAGNASSYGGLPVGPTYNPASAGPLTWVGGVGSTPPPAIMDATAASNCIDLQTRVSSAASAQSSQIMPTDGAAAATNSKGALDVLNSPNGIDLLADAMQASLQQVLMSIATSFSNTYINAQLRTAGATLNATFSGF